MRTLTLSERLVDATFVDWIRLSIWPRVMNKVVHLLAQQAIDGVKAK